ncbi:threonine--tRNA ligase [Longibacter salinarum]|uniref:Threonine--tRNA ligase n=1 Tax=Longibacter salinarum TaxID=1850348 RepID=A0A2A8CU35_9BACT|nr:threonine--tRNA ligase [Longibacter salinarum]PEN11273.1 threonine--tRNA ligase [Longibacter salinarum]
MAEVDQQTITLTLPDGSERSYPAGTTGYDVAASIGAGLARAALAIKVDGEVRDLNRPIEEDADIAILTWDDKEGKETFWHSSAHLMAEALEELYPGVKFTIGPPIDQGFYYDIDPGEHQISSDDFSEIEDKMLELARRDVEYERRNVSKDDAVSYYKDIGNEYKLELIEGLDDGDISFYEQGNFTDLCRGPHIPSTGDIKAPKLLSVAGAYWRGDESNKQLTRIYGITFPKQKLLEEFLERRRLAKERDHRKLGKELNLFTFNAEKVGPGLPMWLPKGAQLRETLENFLKQEQLKAGYEPVVTPHIGRLDLYRTSGHYPYYKESQFPPMLFEGEDTEDEEEDGYLLKPMNCPHHTQIYDHDMHSYRDLPVRLAEFGTVYRFEQSGELGGLTRVRGFTQDDAHIFCTPDQVKGEFKNVIDLTLKVLSALSFDDFEAQISLRDPEKKDKYVGDNALWDQAEQAIREAVAEKGLEAREETGEAAFYGPKLDFMVADALGREWQLGTIQVDYNLPERFDLTYIDENDEKQRPVMIHRAPFGSLERFIGVLIEHCGGNFPTWLAPVQVQVIPVSDDFNDYAESVASKLRAEDIRVKVDEKDETVGYKIRQAETSKVPYMLVVGAREEEAGTVAVRAHGSGEQDVVPADDFVQQITAEVEDAIG